MGEVFLHAGLPLNRPVVLKVIKPDERGPDALDRFIDTPPFRNYPPRHITKTVQANEALTNSHVNDRL